MIDLIKNMRCATCGHVFNLPAETVNFALINYMRAWPFPSGGNLISGLADHRAMTVLCNGCLFKPHKQAVEFRNGQQLLHPVEELTTYEQALADCLPKNLAELSPVNQVARVLLFLWRAGHRGDERSGSLLADWLLTRLMKFVPITARAEDFVCLIIRRVFYDHDQPGVALEKLDQVVNFSAERVKEFCSN